jgi:hypothetical protein
VFKMSIEPPRMGATPVIRVLSAARRSADIVRSYLSFRDTRHSPCQILSSQQHEPVSIAPHHDARSSQASWNQDFVKT